MNRGAPKAPPWVMVHWIDENGLPNARLVTKKNVFAIQNDLRKQGYKSTVTDQWEEERGNMQKYVTVPVDRVIKAEPWTSESTYFILMMPGEGLAPTETVHVWGDEYLKEIIDHWENTGRVKVRAGFPRPLSNGELAWDYDEYEPHSIIVTEARDSYYKKTSYEQVTSDEWKKRQLAKTIVKALRRDPEPIVRKL